MTDDLMNELQWKSRGDDARPGHSVLVHFVTVLIHMIVMDRYTAISLAKKMKKKLERIEQISATREIVANANSIAISSKVN